MTLPFQLAEAFVQTYADRTPPWGFPVGAGNTIGELTFLSKYSRLKPDGTRERWHECCQRVINGTWSILLEHARYNRLPWDETTEQQKAETAFDRMWSFKWLPPGRGLHQMGTKLVNEQRNSAPLQNCAFISTEDIDTGDPTLPFCRLMEMSMLGIGVGFDTRGDRKLKLYEPDSELAWPFVIPDSREGWAESVARLLHSYFRPECPTPVFDYSQIRPAGAPIKTFGGIASGPEPLQRLHKCIRLLLGGRSGGRLNSTDIVDLMNLIGKCVVSGNVRRTAEIALGNLNDEAFLQLKNPVMNPTRMAADGWGYTSNNSVIANPYDDLDRVAEMAINNGEPGLFFLETAQRYGRLVDEPDHKDYRAKGCNPCGEQTLESFECCTLAETFPVLHTDLEDWLRSVECAYYYAKAVTLLPTPWSETNAIMQRNRRIGVSVSGQAQFYEQHSTNELITWLDEGYRRIKRLDRAFSEQLGVRESIKLTSVKPSGTVSLLAGVWPGVSWPVAGGEVLRRIRYSVNDPLLPELLAAGYPAEPDVMEPDRTLVVSFPMSGPKASSETEVSIWHKVDIAKKHQRHWADNQVSTTITFREDEAALVPRVLRAEGPHLKALSFKPIGAAGYAQLPYEPRNGEVFDVRPLDWAKLYSTGSPEGEQGCTTERCLL